MWKSCFGLLCFLSLGLSVSGARLPKEENKDHQPQQRPKRAYPSETAKLWTAFQEGEAKIIPYEIEHYQGMDNRRDVLRGISDFNKYSCVHFRPRVNQEVPYATIRFVNSSYSGSDMKCGASELGMHENNNIVAIDVECRTGISAALTHELFHLVGFAHEFERPDSDDHIINEDSLVKEYPIRLAPNMDLTPYDHLSISSYFNKLNRHTNSGMQMSISRLSYHDIRSINKRYQCANKSEELLYNGCAGSTLPSVIGSGHLSSNNSAYELMESVTVVCDDGYQPNGDENSYCENRIFSPTTLECRKVPCEDNSVQCQRLIHQGVCTRSVKQRNMCPQTCGICNRTCSKLPLVKGPGKILYKDVYGFMEYDVVELKCEDGYIPNVVDRATCRNSEWDVEEFQCIQKAADRCQEEHLSFLHCRHHRRFTTCEPLEVNYGGIWHGRLLPEKEFYQLGDVVQLLCDPGYEPSSSSTGQCRSSYHSLPYFDHGKLSCVRITCEDSSDKCVDIAENERCEDPTVIGLVRKYCKKSCKLCGACKGLPIFDRGISSLSPMTMEYKSGERVEIDCFYGYHAVNGSAECREGEFHPRRLTCEPDASSCTGPPQNGVASFSPIKRHYVYGETIFVKCKVGSRDNNNSSVTKSFPRDDVGRNVICTKGRFEDYNCPHEVHCTLDKVKLEEICGVSYNELPRVDPAKSIYTIDDGFIRIYCDSRRSRFTKCDGTGRFFADGIDYDHYFWAVTYTRHMKEIADLLLSIDVQQPEHTDDNISRFEQVTNDDEQEEKYYGPETRGMGVGCQSNLLPKIYGVGFFYPVKIEYSLGESVYFRCNFKSTVEELICKNGEFLPTNLENPDITPDWVACYEDDCMDISATCYQSGCGNKRYSLNCRKTCGVCEPPPCQDESSRYGGTFTMATPYSTGIRHGVTEVFDCLTSYGYGYNYTVTCDRGELFPPLDYTMCYEGHVHTKFDAECVDRDQLEFCPLLWDDCATSGYVYENCPRMCMRPTCNERYYDYYSNY